MTASKEFRNPDGSDFEKSVYSIAKAINFYLEGDRSWKITQKPDHQVP